MSKRQNNRRRRGGARKTNPNPDPGTIHYLGPLQPRNEDSSTVTLFNNLAITMDAGGNLSGFIDNNPSASRNWTEYSTSWLEYRVLAVKITYFPSAVVNTAVIPGFQGYESVVHALTVTAPASLAQAASTGMARGWIAFRKFVRSWRMETPQEALFQLTSTPAATSQCNMLYAVAGGAAVSYGNIEIQYLVQFKTHAL
jgi:hypothetical protein